MATPPTLSLLQTPSSLKSLLSSINPSSSFSGFRSSARLQENRIVDLSLVRRPSPPGPIAIRCTSGHGEYEYERGVYPRPQEIPWSKEFANSVHLIGTVGAPVQIKQLSSGKVVAWTRLGVKKSASETSWINLTFWDDLANVAFQHVEKGRQVYVSGRLVSDSVDGEDGKWQVFYKVIVQKLNFIERTFPAVSKYEQEMGAVPSVELWQAFFANPTEWWDNRNNKRNPKYPDFKHKDTGEVLWIESKNNPQWVKSQLAVLDSRMATLQTNGSDASVSFMYGDDFTPF
ncbi:protein OSB2, chloroplastic-like isoform X2 [Zingiber officinale]|uniref:protein OSB2, chloroplastic-like isoform X2 n=1 Tax=Zingiber officinale TaxID=94328 RepID=UPI001C4ACFB6|nr:protein OSB2, chloroplastic-like isoform X2 [Zingiber officinale]